MHNRMLPLTKQTLELLVQKHPDPRKLSLDTLMQVLTQSIYLVACDDA